MQTRILSAQLFGEKKIFKSRTFDVTSRSPNIVFEMIRESKKQTQVGKAFAPPEHVKQLKLDIFTSEVQKESATKNKQIIVNKIITLTKYDEMALTVEFKLFPLKNDFSTLRAILWFDEQEVKSALVPIPKEFGDSNEFILKSELDMRGISAGCHTIKVEFHDLFSTCFGIKEETIEYVPQDRKAAYRKVPITKKAAGDDFTIISQSDREIYRDIDKIRKNELDSKRDKW